MQEIQAFEAFFRNFVDINYHNVHDGQKWRYADEEHRATHDALFASLLALLAALNIAYDDFIEQEVLAWASTTGNGNPLALPLTESFVPLYTQHKGYKGSFLIICLQTKAPEKNISAALIQACYFDARANLEAGYGIYLWLEFLGDYPPNPATVGFIAYILPHVNEDWYSQQLLHYIPYELRRNAGPKATALLAQWEILVAKIEAAMRL